MIHIINKLMDSVSPTVESDTQVEPSRLYIQVPLNNVLMIILSVNTMNILCVCLQENIMKIISDYGKFDKFRSLLEVC